MSRGYMLNKLSVAVIVVLVSWGGLLQNAFAEHQTEEIPAPVASSAKATITQQDQYEAEIYLEQLDRRLRSLERQVIGLSKLIQKALAVEGIANEGHVLASDAWNLAVEARSLARNADTKANLALKNKGK